MTDAIEAGAMAIREHLENDRLFSAEVLSKVCIEAAIASGALVPASAGPFTEEIAALAHRFWSIHPSRLDDMDLTREQFYAQEMTKLVQKATASAGAEMRERCAQAGWKAAYDSGQIRRHTDTPDEVANAIRQLDITPASGDYVVVPREPTQAMIDAGDDLVPVARGTETYTMARGRKGYPEDIYRAMLNAASRTGGDK